MPSPVHNVMKLYSARRRVERALELPAAQGRILCLPVGTICIEMSLNEDDTGGFYSIRALAEDATLIASLNFGCESDADNLYCDVLGYSRPAEEPYTEPAESDPPYWDDFN